MKAKRWLDPTNGVNGWTRGHPFLRTVARYMTRYSSLFNPNSAISGSTAANSAQVSNFNRVPLDFTSIRTLRLNCQEPGFHHGPCGPFGPHLRRSDTIGFSTTASHAVVPPRRGFGKSVKPCGVAGNGRCYVETCQVQEKPPPPCLKSDSRPGTVRLRLVH